MGSATFVVVGANLAGGAAATTLRGAGFDGRLVLIGAEPHPPYERPPLSKDYLRGETKLDDAYLRPPEWYGENDVELVLGETAERVDPADRVVELSGGQRVPFDRLLLATGGRNRRLDVPGRDLDGVLGLRTVEDADRIRGAAAAGSKAVVVGAGFIGSEVTASLRQMGLAVDVVEFFETPLFRAIGPQMGRVLEEIHRDHGVRFHLGEGVERFEGDGRVERVVTDHGTAIECDFAVVGVGIEPVADLAAAAGLRVDDGVVVDEFCRTSADGIYAAGDVANHAHAVFGRHLRVEHWDNALKQGAAAARNMLAGPDQGTPFDDPHWFWSDQYDTNLQYAGFAAEWDQIVVRGDLPGRAFSAFYVRDGVVRAVFGVNRGKDVRRSMGLIRAGRPVDPDRLRDEEVDLRKLAADVPGGDR
ncbi:MAG TPA: FAD-dependent oxidoreductase [Actinomycetota bacterium]|nr:FAD-dependent oxidoreductase [Actinomycetota bacterium]